MSPPSSDLRQPTNDVAADRLLNLVRHVREVAQSQLAWSHMAEDAVRSHFGLPALPSQPFPTTPGRRPRGPRSRAAAAEQVLREAGTPLETNEIVRRIVAAGLYPAAGDRKQLINSIYSAMRRATNAFVRTRPGEWGLREWAVSSTGSTAREEVPA